MVMDMGMVVSQPAGLGVYRILHWRNLE